MYVESRLYDEHPVVNAESDKESLPQNLNFPVCNR